MPTALEKPIQVYLDSSDFSNLANPSMRTRELAIVEDRLLGWQESGLIELRFSYVHIIEGAPVRAEDLQFGKARFALIKRLCGSRCLASPFTIIKEELRSIGTDVTQAFPGGVYRDTGEWIPELDSDTFDLPSPKKMLLDEISSMSLGRSARRSAQKRLFDAAGRMRSSTEKLLHGILPQMLCKVAEQYPLSAEAGNAFSRYLTGSGNRQDVAREIRTSITDLDCFGQWYEKQWHKVSPTSSWLRQSGDKLRNVLVTQVKEFNKVPSEILHDGQRKRLLSTLSRDAFKTLVDEMPTTVAKHLAASLGFKDFPEHVASPWEKMPALQLR